MYIAVSLSEMCLPIFTETLNKENRNKKKTSVYPFWICITRRRYRCGRLIRKLPEHFLFVVRYDTSQLINIKTWSSLRGNFWAFLTMVVFFFF